MEMGARGFHGQRQFAAPIAGVASDATRLGPLPLPPPPPRQPVAEDANQACDGIVAASSSATNTHRRGHPAVPLCHEIADAVPASADDYHHWSVQSAPSSVEALGPSDPQTTSPQHQQDQLPLPSPTTAQDPDSTVPLPTSGPFGCQTTIMGAALHPCAALKTTHTSTTTIFASINCHGCTSVHVIAPVYPCPMVTLAPSGEPMVTATTPYTWVSTMCEMLTALDQLTETGPPPTVATFSPIPFATPEAGTVTAAVAAAVAREEMTTQVVWPTSVTMDELPRIAVPDGQVWEGSPTEQTD